MPWLTWWSASSKQDANPINSPTPSNRITTLSTSPDSFTTSSAQPPTPPNSRPVAKPPIENPGRLLQEYPGEILLAAVLTVATTYISLFHKRIPTAPEIPRSYFRKRSLFGTVTSVGDGDNFRLFHTPLGRWAGWNIFRQVPKDKKTLHKRGTIHIRLAGVDAPEAAHFGRPAQPYSKEALEWLTNYVGGRKVRCYLHRPDQYSRAVATVYVWKGFLRRDVGLQMIKAGLATVYEAKTGAEFGGEEREIWYRLEEGRARGRARGMWKGRGWFGGNVETPHEYKAKYRVGGEQKVS